MLKAVTRCADALLPDFGGSQIQGIECGLQTGIADNMETALDSQERAGSQVRGRLVGGKVSRAPLPGCIGVRGRPRCWRMASSRVPSRCVVSR